MSARPCAVCGAGGWCIHSGLRQPHPDIVADSPEADPGIIEERLRLQLDAEIGYDGQDAYGLIEGWMTWPVPCPRPATRTLTRWPTGDHLGGSQRVWVCERHDFQHAEHVFDHASV